MTSLGFKLRSQRERLGLTVSEVAIQTKIREAYLEAIENDNLDEIPGGFFSRSFVRQYAKALGFKQGDIETDLDAVVAPQDDAVSVEKIYTEYRPTAQAHGDRLPGEEDEPQYLHQAEFLRDKSNPKLWVALAMVLIATSIGYLSLQRRPETAHQLLAKVIPAQQKIEWPPLPAVKASNVPVLDSTPEPSSDAETKPSAPAPQSAPPVAASAAPAPQAASGSPVEVAVVAKEKSWVRLIADGNKLFGGTLEAGERRTLNGALSAVVFTGNAGGVEVVYNGKPLGPVGPRGLVRTAVFTPLGYEIRRSEIGKPDGGPQLGASAQP